MENQATVRRAKIVMFALCIVMLMLFGIRLYIVQSYTTQGIELGEIQNKIKELNTENGLLEQQVLENESLTVIATKAAAMGFIDGTNSTIYLP